jgi:hypothetical protein
MAEIINLNKARKSRDKADAQSRAEENRVKFGRTKAEKDASRREAETRDRHLDSHKRRDDE